jgi:hypothetical protein
MLSGVLAGQYSRLTELVLTGQISQAGSVLFRPQDILLDMVLGGAGGALAYGIQRGVSGIAQDIMQRLSDNANAKLSANPGIARNVLTLPEYALGQRTPSLAKPEYGNAIERLVARDIEGNPLLSKLFRHIGGKSNVDFVGRGPFSGLNFDITTNSPREIASHYARSYSQGMIILTYSRPTGFTVFP